MACWHDREIDLYLEGANISFEFICDDTPESDVVLVEICLIYETFLVNMSSHLGMCIAFTFIVTHPGELGNGMLGVAD